MSAATATNQECKLFVIGGLLVASLSRVSNISTFASLCNAAESFISTARSKSELEFDFDGSTWESRRFELETAVRRIAKDIVASKPEVSDGYQDQLGAIKALIELFLYFARVWFDCFEGKPREELYAQKYNADFAYKLTKFQELLVGQVGEENLPRVIRAVSGGRGYLFLKYIPDIEALEALRSALARPGDVLYE